MIHLQDDCSHPCLAQRGEAACPGTHSWAARSLVTSQGALSPYGCHARAAASSDGHDGVPGQSHPALHPSLHPPPPTPPAPLGALGTGGPSRAGLGFRLPARSRSPRGETFAVQPASILRSKYFSSYGRSSNGRGVMKARFRVRPDPRGGEIPPPCGASSASWPCESLDSVLWGTEQPRPGHDSPSR